MCVYKLATGCENDSRLRESKIKMKTSLRQNEGRSISASVLLNGSATFERKKGRRVCAETNFQSRFVVLL